MNGNNDARQDPSGRPIRPSAARSNPLPWSNQQAQPSSSRGNPNARPGNPRPQFAAPGAFFPVPRWHPPTPAGRQHSQPPEEKKAEEQPMEMEPAAPIEIPKRISKEKFVKAMPKENLNGCYVQSSEQCPALSLAEPSMKREDLPGMLKYGAACSNSKVCRIVFASTEIRFKMDTKESIVMPANAEAFRDICNTTTATESLVIVFATADYRVCLKADWRKFTLGTTYVSFSGLIPRDAVYYIVNGLKTVGNIHFHCFRFRTPGRLQTLIPMLPDSLEKLYFDARGTDTSTFIDNVTTLYHGFFTQKRNQVPCFREVTLIVTDFAEKYALQAQVDRLAEMLIDEKSSAVVATTLHGNDGILEDLDTLGFEHTHDGYIADPDNAMEKYSFWMAIYNSREIVFAFKDHRCAPIAASTMPIIR